MWRTAASSALTLMALQGPELERVGSIQHELVREASGLARAARPDVFWVHNDSGHGPRLFAIDGTGRTVGSPAGYALPGATNRDWEDLAMAEDLLFVADLGNNLNARQDLGVYVLEHPEEVLGTDREAFASVRFLPVAYPDQESFPAEDWRFDCEAVFACDGDLYLLTKHRSGAGPKFVAGTRLYRLDLHAALAAAPGEVTLLQPMGAREDITGPTGAALSPDGTRLAVLTYKEVLLLERPGSAPEQEKPGVPWLEGATQRFSLNILRTRQAEAICWVDADTLLLANESSDLFRVALNSGPERGESRPSTGGSDGQEVVR